MTSSKKKAAEAAKSQTEKAYSKVFTFEVSKVRTLKSVETKDYPTFVGWPQRKGTDGNYYNVCSFFLSPEDTGKIIEAVQAELDKDDEDELPM